MLVHLVQSAFAAQEFAVRLTEKSPTKQEPYTTWTVEETRQPISANVEGAVMCALGQERFTQKPYLHNLQLNDTLFMNRPVWLITGICTQMS